MVRQQKMVSKFSKILIDVKNLSEYVDNQPKAEETLADSTSEVSNLANSP